MKTENTTFRPAAPWRAAGAALGVLVTFLTCTGQEYTHTLVGQYEEVLDIGFGPGGYWYTATTEPWWNYHRSWDLYVNGENYSAPILPEWRLAGGAVVRSDGNVIWHAYFGPEENYNTAHLFINDVDDTARRFGPEYLAGWFYVNAAGTIAQQVGIRPRESVYTDTWVGDRNISLEVLGNDSRRLSVPRYLTESGDIYWQGRGRVTDYQEDIFFNETNLSASLLGPNRYAGFVGANESGLYVWSGRSDLTGGYQNVFRGQENYSGTVFGGAVHKAHAVGVSRNGHVAWMGHLPGNPVDVFRDDENLSEFLGPGRYTTEVFAWTSPSGKVLWNGGSPELGRGNWDVFLDRENLSLPLLGRERLARSQGFTAGDVPLWTGAGILNPQWDVFAGSHNLSVEAYGGIRGYHAWEAAGNAQGDVLWYARHGDFDELWLSRPAPEPGAWALSLPALLVFALRRRR